MSNIYEALRERLDMFPQGFPKTESGVEIEVLKHLFTDEEAEIMMFLRPSPEPVSVVAERMHRDENELGEILYTMSRKGLILRFKASETEVFYFLAPWMVGIWEFQIKNLTQENIGLYERFYEEGIVRNNQNKNIAGFRVIPIEKEIKGFQEIQSFEKISEIIDSQTRFAVADCICRKEARMMGKGCDKLLEACMSFGVAADYYIENEFAREISKEEAKEILIKTEESGLVHFSSNHAANKIFICNCCGCCCKALANITKYNNPGVIAPSNYYAAVDQETCDGCETCIDRCQVEAIKLEDGIAVIETDRCIGCGLCVSTCPSESITMNPKPSDGLSKIYADDNELIQAAAKDTNRIYPFE